MESTEGAQQTHLTLANNLFLLTHPDVDDIEKVRLRDDVISTVTQDDMAPLYESLGLSGVLEIDQKVLDDMRVKIADELNKLDEKFHGFLNQARNTCARQKDEPTVKDIGLCTCARFIYL